MSEEIHIAGILVHTDPRFLESVSAAVLSLAGAEIHAASPEGKLVVTLEASVSREIISHLNSIQQFDGVLSAALVYQHSEDLDSMNEEVCDENLAPGIH